ncbi:MAG TPA: YidC/Oxa1 family membrane protein insertase [Candidatus Limnocylindrales bacterium]|nr:YidC/Oxa1 family membrane protein insertase [Candidatus Limnocylindrales bacterium]
MRPRPSRPRVHPALWALAAIGLIVLVALLVAACTPPTSGSEAPASGSEAPASVGAAISSGASAAPSPSVSPTPQPTPLHPAALAPDPGSLIGWTFTPIFQLAFILLAGFYKVTGDIGIAIILLTIIIRAILIPLYRRQLVNQRHMQMIQPEIQEIARRYKGDRNRQYQAQQALYRERGVSPTSGCLPLLLQTPLLYVMYQVIRDGLTNFNVNQMLNVGGVQLISLPCATTPQFTTDAAGHSIVVPCINTTVGWLFGLNAGQPHVDISVLGFGISFLAIFSALLQLVQSKMTLPATNTKLDDPTTRTQRQTLVILPFIFVFFASFLPAGLYIYYIVSTLFGIVQQYLIIGFGSLFPLFGWTPGFAVDHKPRFPVAAPAAPTSPPRAAGAPARPTPERSAIERATSANATIKQRGRQGRRGRRR